MGDIGGKPLADESGVETSRVPAAFLGCGHVVTCICRCVHVLLVCGILQTCTPDDAQVSLISVDRSVR